MSESAIEIESPVPEPRRRGAPPGTRYGGRTKGTPNRSKDEARRIIEEACPGWNPLAAMAQAAMKGGFQQWDFVEDKPATNELGLPIIVPIGEKTRAVMLKEVNEYIHPKRKAIEVSDDNKESLPAGIAVTFVRSVRPKDEEPSTEKELKTDAA